jgi:hypothetical protein
LSEKKSSILSVRIHDAIKKKLIVESELEGVNMNTLISKILTDHVEWDKFAEDIGFVSVTKPFLRAILEALDEDVIKHVAITACRSAFKDAVIYTRGALTYENVITTLDLWLSSSHIMFRHVKKDTEKYIIQHELGERGAVYFSTFINAVLNDIGYRTTNEVNTQQNIVFEIERADSQ